MLNIDQSKLNLLTEQPLRLATSCELRRHGGIFFVGGELPVNDTMETMFESHCMESTELFYLSFGDLQTFSRGEEMARQIKKNFNARLMGRFDYPVPQYILERAYAAGVDILDIPLVFSDVSLITGGGLDKSGLYQTLLSARSVFPVWSVVSTVLAAEGSSVAIMSVIDRMLEDGIIPLVAMSGNTVDDPSVGVTKIFKHLASGWKRYEVPLKPYLPLITHMTPLILKKQAGLFRSLIDKIQDRQQLAASDLRRHLRVHQAEDSLDSAGL